jgi:SAM-dependent methyltransferase
MASVPNRADPAYAGQAIYSRAFLRVYDFVAYDINSRFYWRCPKSRLVELYDANLSGRHLDIGVGAGRLLDGSRFPVAAPELTLMDLNPNSLATAARQLARYAPRTHRANVLEPWGLAPGSFDSVAMSHLLHCLPGALPEKAAVPFAQAREALAPGGTFFGVTILGRGVELSSLGRATVAIANSRGVMSNRDDDLAGVEAALAASFDDYAVELVGTVAVFTARAS